MKGNRFLQGMKMQKGNKHLAKEQENGINADSIFRNQKKNCGKLEQKAKHCVDKGHAGFPKAG